MSEAVKMLLDKLPEYQGNKTLVTRRQDTFDIIREIMAMHNKSAKLYNTIALDHWSGDEMSTARHLFDFMRRHVPYTQEKTYTQTVKYPQSILAERLTFGNDCKHYSSYIVGVGAALNRMGYPVKCFYRFGCYRDKTGKVSKHPGHVFAVFVINGQEIWIDPVPEIGGFNSRTLCPVTKIDKMPPMAQQRSIGSLYEISGFSGDNQLVAGPHHHGRHGHHPHYNNGAFEQVPHERYPMQHHYGGAHWLDRMPTTHGHGHHHSHYQPHWQDGEDMGKAGKGKAKVKKLINKAKHIKVQPGKLLKKVDLTAPRNAYLALLKMNFGHLAVNIHNRIKKDPAAWKKISEFWEKKLGGNSNKLHTAIDGGVNTHNKLHPKHKVSGMDSDMYMSGGFTNDYVSGADEAVGVVAAAGAAALLAAAAPVIAAISNIFKSLGIKHDNVEDAADNADVNAAADHNDATDQQGDGNKDINPDGSVDHGNGVTTKVTKNADGSQTMTYDVKDPTEGDNITSYSKTKTKTSKELDTDGDGQDDETVTEKTKTITKHNTGDSFADMMANTKDFVMDHKWWFIGGGLTLLGLIVIPRVLSNRPKPRRR